MGFFAAFSEVRRAQAEQKRLAHIRSLFNEPVAVEIMTDTAVKAILANPASLQRLQQLMQEDFHPDDSGILLTLDGKLKADAF